MSQDLGLFNTSSDEAFARYNNKRFQNDSPCEIFSDLADNLNESYSSDTSEDSIRPIKKKFSDRSTWTNEDTEKLRKEFQDFIQGRSCYPSKDRIKTFLEENKNILKKFKYDDKFSKMRIKLNNCKRLYIDKCKNFKNKIVKF